MSTSRLRGPDLAVHSPGIRRRSDASGEDLWDVLRAVQELHPRAVFTHSTSAAAWGLWVPPWFDGLVPIHLSRSRNDGGRPRRQGVRAHELNPRVEVVEYRGVRLASPAWTWVDLAGLLRNPDDLVAAGDSLLQRDTGPAGQREPGLHPLSSIQDMRRVVEARKKFKGIVAARGALELVRAGADSAPESRVRSMIVHAGLPEPLVNPPVRLKDGGVVLVDLAWPRLKVCIQYEGDHHRTDKDQFQRDIARDRKMQREGWIVLRVAAEVLTPAGEATFLADLNRALAGRGRRR